MACHYPLEGYKDKDNGAFTRDPKRARDSRSPYSKLTVPCGACLGCRIDKSREWAIRCTHELSYPAPGIAMQAAFITLTYDNEHLPEGGTLEHKHFQDFMKRLRKKTGEKLSYLMCGEYGDKTRRPHYHAVIFGYGFKDRWLYRHDRKRDVKIFRSKELESTWTAGISTIGNVTWQSAAYVARYTTKKITGDKATDHYRNVCVKTGEIFDIKPEYAVASKRPSLGKAWFEKFHTDVFPADRIVGPNGKIYPVPRYYDKLYQRLFPEKFEEIRYKRTKNAVQRDAAVAPLEKHRRLKAKEEVKKAQTKQLLRKLDASEDAPTYIPMETDLCS